MFTWICPQCGREVPPSYTECPDCARKAASPQPEPAAAPPPAQPAAPPPPRQYAPPQPQYSPQPQYAPPQPQSYPAQQQYAPPTPPYAPPPPAPRGGLPTWAMAILFAFAIFGVVMGIHYLLTSNRAAKPAAAVESPAAKTGGKTNPYQKYIEVSGVRFVEDARKKTTLARFVITNHSNADISGLAGNVTVWGRTRNSEEDAAGTFTFNTDLKGYESRDMTVPLTTRLKIYELPDWQNVSTDVQITSPQ